MVPSSAAQLSTVRHEVVPTQMTRPPARLVSLIRSAVSLWDDAVFTVHLVALNGVLLHGPEGAEPPWSVTYPTFTPIVCTRSEAPE